MEGGGSCSLNSRLQHIQIRLCRVRTWCPCPRRPRTLCHLGSQAHAARPRLCLDKIGSKKQPGKPKYASAWGQPCIGAARCKVFRRGRDRSPRRCQVDGCTCIPHAPRFGYLVAESGCSSSSPAQPCCRLRSRAAIPASTLPAWPRLGSGTLQQCDPRVLLGSAFGVFPAPQSPPPKLQPEGRVPGLSPAAHSARGRGCSKERAAARGHPHPPFSKSN